MTNLNKVVTKPITTWNAFQEHVKDALSSLGATLSSSTMSKLAASVALVALLSSDAFAQRKVSDKDLEKQYEAVMKDLKKDPAVAKISAMYGKELSSSDVVDLIDPEVDYVIKNLIPQIYIDHLQINADLGAGLNKQNVLPWVYLNKQDAIKKFSDALGSKMRSFKKTNKASYNFAYPVGYIDDHAAYVTDPVFKKQLSLLESVVVDALNELDKQFVQGKITLNYPLGEMYNHHFKEFAEIKDSKNRSLTDYIVSQPTSAKPGSSATIEFDFNKFAQQDLSDGTSTDQFAVIEKIFQEAMFIAGVKAFVVQYTNYIDYGRKDIGTTGSKKK